MRSSKLRPTELGVHIGSDQLTMLVPSRDGSSQSVALESVSLPAASVYEDPMRIAAAGPVLRRWIREKRIQPRRIRFALDFPQSRTRSFRLPWIPDADRIPVVRGELESLCGMEPDAGALDFLWLESGGSESSRGEADVIAFFLSETELEALEQLCASLGTVFDGAEPATIAATRTVLAQFSDQPTAVLHTAGEVCELVVSDGSKVRVVRRISGWTHSTDPTSVYEKPSQQEIPDIPGFAPEPPSSHASAPSAGDEFLVAELVRTLAFFARTFPQVESPRVVHVLGAEADIARLARAAEAYDLDCVPFAPDRRRVGCDANSALAVHGVVMPSEAHGLGRLALKRQDRQARIRRRAPLLIRVAVAASFAVVAGATTATVALSREESRAIEGKLDETMRLAEIGERRGARMRYLATVEAANAMHRSASLPVPELLGRLAVAATPGVSVGKFEIHPDGNVQIEGDALDARQVEAFAERLSTRSRLGKPRFDSLRQDKEGRISFRVGARFGGKPENGQ